MVISFFIFMCLHARVFSQNNGDLRLVQKNVTNSSFTQGRLEIFLNDEWGTICEDHFSAVEADVACHQLGYERSIGYPNPAFHTRFGKGYESQPIWLDNIGCTDPSGLHILSCPNPGIGVHNCDHFSDIAISCSSVPIASLAVRLNGRTYQSQGRLEVKCEEEWLPVCAQDIDTDTANLVCRELGFTGARTFEKIPKSTNFISIQLDGLLDCFAGNCVCHENNLCSEEAFIECSHTIQFGAIRLVNNSDNYNAILEIFINGAWRKVCGDSFTELDANAVCNKLGYKRAETVSTTTRLQDDYLIWNKHSDCNFNIEESFDCLASPSQIMCSQNASVTLKCTDDPVEPTSMAGPDIPGRFSLDTLIAICLASGALLCFCCLFMVVCCTHIFCGYYVASKRDRPLMDRNSRQFTFMDVDSKLENEYELERLKPHTFLHPVREPLPYSTPQAPNASTPDHRPTNSPYPFPQEIERIKLRCSQENLLAETTVPTTSQSPAEYSHLEQLAHQLEPPLVRQESLNLETISEEEASLEMSGEEQTLKMEFDNV